MDGIIGGAPCFQQILIESQWSPGNDWVAEWVIRTSHNLTNRTNGEQNAQRTISFLTQLATFFSQPRYHNLVTMVKVRIIKE